MEFSEQAPLGEQFYSNPYEYLQKYIRNLNNQIFLSEYQINNLYALLLIGRNCPWDGLRTTSEHYKQEVDTLVERKITDVKCLLDNMSQLYEDKVKKDTFNQIERLMGILKARNKSIYIEKCSTQPASDSAQDTHHEAPTSEQGDAHHEMVCQHHADNSQNREEQSRSDGLEVFGLIEGLGNISNLSALALGNCLEYNTTERFIKFKMTKNYIMTIKNDDPVSYDLTSQVSKVPSSLFTHHVFPYLTALELFRVRSTCKEWLGLVKDSWHSTFKREMYTQLLAGQFCKDIEFYYKCIQLRNPFFQKISLLLHALVQIIQWGSITAALQENRINAPFKRVLLVLLKLLGDEVAFSTFNDLTEELWQQHKHKIPTLKQKVTQFFSNFNGNSMTINQLRDLKIHVFDHPFMRGDEMQTEEKTPLLLLIFVKQLNLQQILKNHLHFSQEYLYNSKKRLDGISAKMPHQRGFLEGVYKILLLKSIDSREPEETEEEPRQMPNFQQMIQTVFENKESEEPDFYIKTRSTRTSIYMDRATKLDIIISTVRKSYGGELLEGLTGENQGSQPMRAGQSQQKPSTQQKSDQRPSQQQKGQE